MFKNMQVFYRQIDKSLPMSKYETKGSCGFDFLARKKTIIKPQEIALIPGNLVIKTPKDYMLMVSLRSSAPKKKSLLMPHGVGIIDQDYCGKDDEILIQVYNFSNQEVVVEKGEKIAQGVFVKIMKADFKENSLTTKNRGGFGSTDTL
jgi:dUTP pyrophosphatase